jgi:hypothetical protein
MSEKIVASEPPRHSPPPAVRVFKFEAPKELPAHFGAAHASESEIGLPFHYMRKAHGEIWSMRIEPLGAHIVNGVPVMGHQWIYRQELPERVGSSA